LPSTRSATACRFAVGTIVERRFGQPPLRLTGIHPAKPDGDRSSGRVPLPGADHLIFGAHAVLPRGSFRFGQNPAQAGLAARGNVTPFIILPGGKERRSLI